MTVFKSILALVFSLLFISAASIAVASSSASSCPSQKACAIISNQSGHVIYINGSAGYWTRSPLNQKYVPIQNQPVIVGSPYVFVGPDNSFAPSISIDTISDKPLTKSNTGQPMSRCGAASWNLNTGPYGQKTLLVVNKKIPVAGFSCSDPNLSVDR